MKVDLISFAISSFSVHKGSVALNIDNSYRHSSYIVCNQQKALVSLFKKFTTKSTVTILVNRFVRFV